MTPDAHRMNDTASSCAPCDLCRTLTPAALLRPEAFQEWDALCPACWRKAAAQTALELAREAAGGHPVPRACLPGGWSLWAYPATDDSPYRYRAVEIWRHEWPAPRCVNPWSLPPQMHVVDLYWRPLAHTDAPG